MDEHWRSGDSITICNSTIQEFIHKNNDMRVLIVEMPTAPIAGYMRVVNAGSRDEEKVCGKGIAHFIEHMAFRIDDGKFWKFEKLGHEDNAMTEDDATSYYDFGMASHVLDVIEVDGSRFRCSKVPADGIPIEREAVLNEEQRNHQAAGMMFRTSQALSHLFDNYHMSTIGRRKDIISATAEEMQAFREKYYKLNNSTFIVTGNVFAPEVLSQFHKVHGSTAKATPVNHDYAPDMVQNGKRTVEINTPAPCSMLCMTYHSPPANSKDSVCLSLLKHIIYSNMEGRGRSLIDKNIVHDINVYAPRKRDSYIWCVHATLGNKSRGAMNAAEINIFGMLYELKEDVSKVELERAKNILRMNWSNLNTIHEMTMELGKAVSLGNWKDVGNRLTALESITPKDIKHAVATYLNPYQCSSVHVYPHDVNYERTSPTPMPLMDCKKSSINNVRKPLVWKVDVKPDITNKLNFQLLKVKTGKTHFSISVPFDNHKKHLASLFCEYFGNGCSYNNKYYTGSEISQRTASMGIDYDINLDHRFIHFRGVFNNVENTSSGTDFLVNGMLKNMTFVHSDDTKAFNVKKTSMLAELRSLRTNQKYLAKEMLITKMFAHSNYSKSLNKKIDKISSVRMGELKKFYENTVTTPMKWYCTLVTTNKNQTGPMKSILKDVSTFNKQDQVKPLWIPLPKKQENCNKIISGYKSGFILIGQTTPLKNYSDESYMLMLGMEPLGSSITSRLMHTIRVEKGCGTYGVYGNVYMQSHAPTYVVFNATFSPKDQTIGVKYMHDIIDNWLENGITMDELNTAKKQLLGARSLEMDNMNVVSSVFHRHLHNNKNAKDEWKRYENIVKKTTLEQVNKVIKSSLQRKKFITVSVGPSCMNDDSDSD